MKPNLFRSVSSSLAATFPLLPRIKRSFFGLFLFCMVLILLGYSDSNTIEITVLPANATPNYNYVIGRYDAGSILPANRLVIEHPSFLQRTFIPAGNMVDIISLLLLAIASVVIIYMVQKLDRQQLFRADISGQIWLLGGLLILHALVTLYRTVVYIPDTIQSLTHGSFTATVVFPVFICAEFFFALVIMSIGSAYGKAMRLQQEQELTI